MIPIRGADRVEVNGGEGDDVLVGDPMLEFVCCYALLLRAILVWRGKADQAQIILGSGTFSSPPDYSRPISLIGGFAGRLA